MIDQHNRVRVNIEDEMKRSYMDYAMSVIVGRALPDVRDGLKPVHRRCLFAMYDMSNDWNKPYKKSARVVGDVIGKYHPHGDTAVYDTLVRMAQDFSLRYPLIDGQGNFGSIDGDRPAAMRYTEIRMQKLAHELLADIEKETVDTGGNYDDSLREPLVLPSKFPNLLVNGSSGIAVGMATNIPPHNLSEIIDGIVATIKDPEITTAELMEHIPGPDFPTGGFICGRDEIVNAYETGRGIIKMRAKVILETKKKSERQSIVVTELPYQVNKARLVEKIAELVKEKKIEGISDLRDESDREGMRVVIELKKDEKAVGVLNQLFKLTPMQSSFGIIMLAIDKGRPRIFSLKEAIEAFIDHRKEIITKRTLFELKKAEARAHILDGLMIALENIDEVVNLIKKSASPAAAKEGLMKRFALSDLQAQAILDLRLHRLTGLEREKLQDEYRYLKKYIVRLKQILASEKELLGILAAEMQELKELYGDQRRSVILSEDAKVTPQANLVEEDMVVSLSYGNYVKRASVSAYRAQRRNSEGKAPRTDDDFTENLIIGAMKDHLLVFTNIGKVHWLKVEDVPEASRAAKGKAIVNLVTMSPGEKAIAVLPVKEFSEDKFVTMATVQGTVKKTSLDEYSNPRNGGIIAITLDEGDSIIGIAITDGRQELLLATKDGIAIRFKEDEARAIGRASRGVRGIILGKGDQVVSMITLNDTSSGSSLLTITEKGFGKRTEVSDYPIQSRSGKGVINIKVADKNGRVAGVRQVSEDSNIMVLTNSERQIAVGASEVPHRGRNTMGDRFIELAKDEKVTLVMRLAEREQEAGAANEDE